MRRALVVVLVASCFACAREEAVVSRHVATSAPAQAASVLGGAPAQAVQPGEAMDAETLYERGTATSDGYREVTPDDVARAHGKVRIIDVRQPAEFTGELGHIPGATLVPLDTLLDVAQAWDRGESVVLVCRSDRRSGIGATQLVAAGFKKVMNMSGGMLAYNERGLPVER